MKQTPPEPTTRRLKIHAAIAFAALVALTTAGVVALHFRQASRLRVAAMETARRLADEGRVDLAVQNLDALLLSRPRDPEALEFQGRLLAESARSLDQLLRAASVNDLFVRTAPDAPGAQEARRRTAELYIRFGDLYLESRYHRVAPEISYFNLRYRAAAVVAQGMIDRGADDAGARLLLARAKDGLTWTGDPDMLDEAAREYRRTLAIDPGNVQAAERLANLLHALKHEPSEAIRVLDELMKHRADSPELRLARQRFFVKVGRDDLASAELDVALALAPDDPSACLEAAEMALRRGRMVEARKFLERIRPENREGLRSRLVRGLIELHDDHPEQAMEIWRRGLVASQGSDAMLSWNLAFALIQLGKLDEAAPLIDQYRRLVEDPSSPMLELLLAVREQKTGQSFRAALRLESIRSRVDARWRLMVEFTLGRCYSEIGDSAKAIGAYRRVLEENPGAVAVRVELAEVLENVRPRDAAGVIEEGLRSRPDEPALWVALASALIREQENLPAASRTWDTFQKAMARAEDLAPSHPELTLIRSRRRSLDGRTDEAAAMLEQAIRLDPRKSKLWETYIEALLAANRTSEALEVLERASNTDAVGETVGVRLIRFGILKGLGRARQGRERLTRDVDQLLPDQQARIWEGLGRDLNSRGDAAGARGVYAEWARRSPNDERPRLALLEMTLHGVEAEARAAVDALRGLGGAAGVAAQLDRARELIRSSTKKAAGSTPEDERLLEAGQILDRARAAAPRVGAIEVLQGELFERRGQGGEAAMAYRRAWEGGFEAILPRLVDLQARQNPRELERMCSLDGSPRLIRLATRAFLRAGQPDRAALVVADRPAEPETPEMLAWRSDLLQRLGEPDRAEVLLRNEALRRPEAVEPWLALLRLQARLGHSEAIASTLDGARKAIKDERAEFVEARLSWAAGDRAGADRAFRAALERNPDDIEVLLSASDHDQETGRSAEVRRRLGRVLALKPGHRGASRRLAMDLTAGPFGEEAWERAWAVLGPESTAAEDPEDRLVRAVLLSKAPRADHRRRAPELLQVLLEDLSGQDRVASMARGVLARIWLADGRAERVVRMLGPEVDRDDGDASAIALYVEALLASGRLDLAGEQLGRLATIVPGDDREAQLRARLVAARARPGEAARDLELAFRASGASTGSRAFGREAFAIIVAASPPADDVAERLGLALASVEPGASWMPAMIAGRQGRADEALRLCKAAAEVASPSDARETCRVASGVTLGDDGVDRRGQLETILESAARRDPDGTEIPLLFAQLRHRQGRFEEVVRLYREVLGRRPDLRPSILNNIAWTLCEDLRRPEEAIRVADDLLAAGGRVAAALDTRGVILTRLRRPLEAIRDLEESVRLAPDPVHLFHLARAYRDAGNARDFSRCRDLALRAGLSGDRVAPSERAELTAMMRP